MHDAEAHLVDDLKKIFDTEPYSVRNLTTRLKNVHPIDIAVALQYLEGPEKIAVLSTLSDRVAALVLDETDEETKKAYLEQVDEQHLARLLELMPPDEGADLLELASEEVGEEVLEKVEEETAQELRELRQYEPDTAGGQMTIDFVSLRENMTAAEAVKTIQGAVDAEYTNWIHVTDDLGRLAAVVSIQQIISAPAERPLTEFMYRDVHYVTTNVDQEEAAQLADRYNLPSVPVTDENGLLKGIITLDDVLDVMSEEASEDMYLLSGTQSLHPMAEAVHRRALKRMPWLLVTVGMGLVVMFIYSRYEGVIRRENGLWLVFFVPLVQALGGNVGIQSSTMIVRGLATGEIDYTRLLRVIFSEMGVGLSIGVVFAVIVGTAATAITADARLGMVVSAAIVAGVLISSLTGTVIPLLCNKFGVDPAITAGPFITALNDVSCLTIYFTIAALVFVWLV